jgi:predicted flap endonuclease-1-like 5' DNA nuclease
MKLQQLVDALDAQIVKGDIFGAFEAFAADHCVTLSNEADKTYSKSQKAEALRGFLSHVARTNRIERFAVQLVNDQVTDSQFVFDFTDHYGRPMVYNEVIRRTWDNGKVVEEIYLMGHSLEVTKTATGAKKTSATATKKAAEPAADKKPATKSAKTQTEKPAPAKADDLTIVEGIGPKIADLLKAAGIATFAQLAASKPAAIKAILETAGKRYQMHDPATWPKQAALARDGKSAELAKLQGELKAGK